MTTTSSTSSPDGATADLAELIALRLSVAAQRWRPLGCRRLGEALGAHVGARLGQGMAFAESRAYQPGDDRRSLDWKQTARRGKPFTKLFQAERERPLWLLVDQGPSLHFGTRVAFKSVIAARAAAAIAWQAEHGGDRVGGGVTDGRRFALSPAQRGRAGVLGLCRLLAPAPDAPSPLGQAGDLDGALRALAAHLRPGGRFVVLSDFHALDDAAAFAAFADALLGLARHQGITLIQVADPLEAAPPAGPGPFLLADAAGEWQFDPADPAVRAAWGAPLQRRRQALAALAARCAGRHQLLFSDQGLEALLGRTQRGHPAAAPV